MCVCTNHHHINHIEIYQWTFNKKAIQSFSNALVEALVFSDLVQQVKLQLYNWVQRQFLTAYIHHPPPLYRILFVCLAETCANSIDRVAGRMKGKARTAKTRRCIVQYTRTLESLSWNCWQSVLLWQSRIWKQKSIFFQYFGTNIQKRRRK